MLCHQSMFPYVNISLHVVESSVHNNISPLHTHTTLTALPKALVALNHRLLQLSSGKYIGNCIRIAYNASAKFALRVVGYIKHIR